MKPALAPVDALVRTGCWGATAAAGRAAAVLALLLAAATAVPAQAQEQTTLLSNLGSSGTSSQTVGDVSGTETYDHAQSFSTGEAGVTVTLGSVKFT